MTGGSVVPETIAVEEEDFRARMINGLARAQTRVGAKALAYVMDLTTKQLRNLFAGGTTHPKRLWDVLAVEPTVLDDIAAAYGKRLVSNEEATAGMMGTVPVAALLAKLARAECPTSPGGTAKVYSELLDMEADVRAVHALTGDLIAQINDIRGVPRVVASNSRT